MRLWISSRRWYRAIWVVACLLILILLAGGIQIPVPSVLTRARVSVPILTFTPLVIPVIIGSIMASGDQIQESWSIRPIAAFDCLFLTATCGTVLFAGGVMTLVSEDPYVGAIGRTATGTTGLMLLVRPWVGPRLASTVPVGFVIACFAFGLSANRTPRVWAWPLAYADDLSAWVIAIVLWMAGITVTLNRSVPTRRFG